MTSAVTALDLLAALVLESGSKWADVATDWQDDDARAVLTGAVRRHYLLRGRGMSKTSDAAGLALVLLLTEAPARSRSHAYATDADQAAIMLDTLSGYVARTPGLAGAVEIGARTLFVRATGASLTVEASDGASAYGLRPWLTLVDELSMWPSSGNHRRLWSAIVSAVPKVSGSRLLVIGTAGSPTSLGAGAWGEAQQSVHWRTSRRPGPAPWWTSTDIEAVRESLTASEWRRLIACEWAEGDDALTTAEDVAACIRAGSATLAPRPGVEYVAALDVGTRRDLTALAVGHVERRQAGRVVVIDRVLYWRPRDTGIAGRVDLTEVEHAVRRVCAEYRVSRLRFDRMQAEQLTANLARSGVRTDEYVFSQAGANRLARSVSNALRDRAVELPDDDEVRMEATSVRIVETGPGTVKMVNPPGTHDDVVTAIGMVLVDLLGSPDHGAGSITVPTARTHVLRTNTDARPAMPLRLAVRHNAERGPRGVYFVPGVPGAYDDPGRGSV